MITGRQNVIQYAQSLPDKDGQNYAYWKIYQLGRSGGGNPSYMAPQHEGLTKMESIQSLQNVLSIIGWGKYSISFSTDSGKTPKGSFTEEFEIPVAEPMNMQPGIYGPPQPAVQGMSKDEAKEMATDMFNQLMLKQKADDLDKKVKELEKENKELQASVDGPLNQFMGYLAPHIGSILKPQQAAAAPMASIGTLDVAHEPVPAATQDEMEEQLGARIVAVLDRVKEHFETDPVEFLEKLVAKLEENPSMVGLVKGFIN